MKEKRGAGWEAEAIRQYKEALRLALRDKKVAWAEKAWVILSALIGF